MDESKSLCANPPRICARVRIHSFGTRRVSAVDRQYTRAARFICDGAIAEMIVEAECPLCGAKGGRRLLSSPDRFHGRNEPYLLRRCSACSLVWLDNPPSPSEMGRHYGGTTTEQSRPVAQILSTGTGGATNCCATNPVARSGSRLWFRRLSRILRGQAVANSLE